MLNAQHKLLQPLRCFPPPTSQLQIQGLESELKDSGFSIYGHEPDPPVDDLTPISKHWTERNRFRILVMSRREAGKGNLMGFDDVYNGSPFERTVAMKTLCLHGAEQNITRLNNRFSLEINVWCQLQHKNVLPTSYLVKPLSATTTLTMQMISPWIINGNVRDYLADFPDTNRRKLMTEVAEGLRYLHQSGVVHGALSPTNVLIDDAGRPMLSDFGIAAVLEPNCEPLSVVSVRQRMSFVGDKGLDNVYSTSPVTSSRPVCRYMAPELLSNERSYSTTASDVYMFACLCYESFVETPPFADLTTDVDVLLAIYRNERPGRPPAGHPAESRGLDNFMWEIVDSCWRPNSADRPNIHQVHESLQRANYNKRDEIAIDSKEHDGLKILAHL